MKLLHVVIAHSTVQKVVFVSSTSVYGDLEGIVTEETEPKPSTESGKQLIARKISSARTLAYRLRLFVLAG